MTPTLETTSPKTADEQRRPTIGLVADLDQEREFDDQVDGGSTDFGDGPPRPPQRPRLTDRREGGGTWKYIFTYLLLFALLFLINFLAFEGHHQLAKRKGWV